MDINLANMSSTSIDFLPAFKAIGHSLKNSSYKRFFRKPNVADAAQQYEALSLELAREGQREFSAVCSIEAAKCQENLQNPAQQASLYVKAARNYILEHEEDVYFTAGKEKLKNHFRRGHLEQAMQCLDKAVKIYVSLQNFGLAILLLLEMGKQQAREKYHSEALKHYKLALVLAKENFTLGDQFVILQLVITCKVKLTEYDNVLKTINDFLDLTKEKKEEISDQLYDNIIEKFEIMRVCLSLILRTNTSNVCDHLYPETKSDNTMEEMSRREKNLILLKSLVIAVNNSSLAELHHVRNNLISIMDEAMFDLFDVLIHIVNS